MSLQAKKVYNFFCEICFKTVEKFVKTELCLSTDNSPLTPLTACLCMRPKNQKCGVYFWQFCQYFLLLLWRSKIFIKCAQGIEWKQLAGICFERSKLLRYTVLTLDTYLMLASCLLMESELAQHTFTTVVGHTNNYSFTCFFPEFLAPNISRKVPDFRQNSQCF